MKAGHGVLKQLALLSTNNWDGVQADSEAARRNFERSKLVIHDE
jgi:hypothetical protein